MTDQEKSSPATDLWLAVTAPLEALLNRILQWRKRRARALLATDYDRSTKLAFAMGKVDAYADMAIALDQPGTRAAARICANAAVLARRELDAARSGTVG